MIAVRSKGRLGNQLFQIYAAHSARRRREIVLAIGFDRFPDSFLPERTVRIPSRILPTKNHLNFLERKARALGAKGVFGFIPAFRYQIERRKGFLNLSVFEEDWLSESGILNSRVDGFLRQLGGVLANLRNLHASHLFGFPDQNNCFVHVRRGDFLEVPFGSPMALPASWFIQMMQVMRDLDKNVRFIVLSDDIEFCERIFAPYQDVVFWHSEPEVDLAVMAGCDHGILSPSTFSWWGARLASLESRGHFVAPLGWGKWREPGCKENEAAPAPFLKYRELPEQD